MSRVGRVFILLGVVFFMSFGCNRTPSTPAPKPAGRKVDVLATVYPLADLARHIAGDAANVEWLCEGAQRPEAIEAGPDLKQRANRADVMLTSGPWDAWAVAEMSDQARTDRIVEPLRMPAAREADPKAYLWLDPLVVRQLAEAARTRLTIVDPARENEYRQNAATFEAEVDAVHKELTDRLKPLAGGKVLVVRPVWGAFCARYGLVQVAPVETVEEKLSASECKEIARAAKASGVSTLFIDVTTPAAVRQRIEERTGLKVLTLDTLGTSAPDGRSTWARVMRYDLEQLQKGLEGVKAAR